MTECLKLLVKKPGLLQQLQTHVFSTLGRGQGSVQPQLSLGAPGEEASLLKDTVRTGQLEMVMCSFLTKPGPFKVWGFFFF